MVNGEFGGHSLVTRESIPLLMARALPVTLLLAAYAVSLSMLISVPLGIFSAVRQSHWLDYIVRSATLLGQALPNFWVAVLITLGLVRAFRWSPPVIYAGPQEDFWNHIQLVIWPVLILSWEYSSVVTRVTRAAMLEALEQNYIVMARTKGLSEKTVILRHALRNAFIPIITLIGLQFGTLISGVLILEIIFGLPGLGSSLVQAALDRDYPVVQSVITFLVFFMLLINLAVDFTYARLDPRIRY